MRTYAKGVQGGLGAQQGIIREHGLELGLGKCWDFERLKPRERVPPIMPRLSKDCVRGM